MPENPTITTRAATLPVTTHDTGLQLLAASMHAVSTQLDALTDADWSAETDCAGWDVRAMVAHLVGSAQELAHLWMTPVRMIRGRRHYPAMAATDARNQVQLDDFANWDGPQLRSEYRRLQPTAVAGARRAPAPIRRLKVPSGLPGVPRLGVGYLLDVILVRDAWMHGIDLVRATGQSRVGGDHDAPIIEQVLRDLDLSWSGPAIALTLSGVSNRRWAIGAGRPAAEISADAIELCRLLAGRPCQPSPMLITGDSNPHQALLEARVVF